MSISAHQNKRIADNIVSLFPSMIMRQPKSTTPGVGEHNALLALFEIHPVVINRGWQVVAPDTSVPFWRVVSPSGDKNYMRADTAYEVAKWLLPDSEQPELNHGD